VKPGPVLKSPVTMQGIPPAMWAIRSRSSFDDCARAPGAIGIEVRIKPVKGRTAGARPELQPSDHARIDLGPPAATRLLGSLAEPEISGIEQPETGGLEKHATHFAALFPIVATDAAEGVIGELLTQIVFHRVQTFLRAEQVGVKGADALHDKIASLIPDIVPVEDRADAEVEGHKPGKRGERRATGLNMRTSMFG
jgi:hypothetical protein